MSRSNRIKAGVVTDAAGKYPQTLSTQQKKLLEAMRYDENVDEVFDTPVVVSAVDKNGNLLLDATMAAGDEFAFMTRSNVFEAHVNEINGTVVNTFPKSSTDGLELPVLATNGVNAWEVTNGILASNNQAAKTVGTDFDIFFEAKIKIDDVSDLTELWCGFRKAEAYQADPDNYDEMCAYNIGEDADGQIEIHTILNGAATVNTDTTEADWTDGQEKTLLIKINKNGLCSFQIDGSEPTVVPSFTFDSGEVVIPFVCFTTETGDPGVSITHWKAGKY